MQPMNNESNAPRAVVLVSGGLDSATCLAVAKEAGFELYGISFDYGQRHAAELEAARRVAAAFNVVEHKVVTLDMGSIGGSALTDDSLSVPESGVGEGIPVTYVPARNTVFLSLALGWAEVLQAQCIYIGVNAVDYSGYPDCRPEFIAAFQQLANVATKQSVEAADLHTDTVRIEAPLIYQTKAEIIQRGIALGVDYSLTVSCYQADSDGAACGRCDSCRLRKQGFEDAGVADPTRYVS